MPTVPDAGLRKALAANGCKLEKQEVSAESLAALGYLDWSTHTVGDADLAAFVQIQSLEGLQGASKLVELGLTGNAIHSLAPLANNDCLQMLWLGDNQLTDIAALATMPKVRSADFHRNRQLTSLPSLVGAAALGMIDLSGTRVADFGPLAALPKLRQVRVWGSSFETGSVAFESLVGLVARGVTILGEPALVQALKNEAGRRALKRGGPTDELAAALAAAGLERWAVAWAQGPHTRDEQGLQVLHALASAPELDERARANLTRLAVSSGADLNATQLRWPEATVLGVAADAGRAPEYLELLVELGANPSIPAGFPPLALAAQKGDRKSVGLLLDRGADSNNAEVLVKVVGMGDLEILARVLASKPDLNVETAMETPLSKAISMKRDDLARALLDAGAAANFEGPLGRTALFVARQESSYDLLVAAGADPKARDAIGGTILHLYVDLPHAAAPALISRAVAGGVNINTADSQGRTPLHQLAKARAHGDQLQALTKLIPLLIELGADVTALNLMGETARDAANGVMAKAMTAAKVPTGNAVVKKLTKALEKLASGAPAAWDAAKRLSATGQRKALEPSAEVIKGKVRALEGGLAGFSGFNPSSEVVIALLADGPAAITARGDSLLQLTFAESELEIEGGVALRDAMVRALLSAGANPLAIGCSGASVLQRYLSMTRAWDLDVVRRLVAPSTVNAPKVHSPLATAANGLGDDNRVVGLEVIDLLVHAGASLSNPGVLAALCRAGRFDLVRRAVGAGCDPNALVDGRGALHAAVESDAADIVKYLLGRGANPNAGSAGRTPIFGVRSVAVLDLLVAGGADAANVAPLDARTALHAVAQNWRVSASMAGLVRRFEELGISRDTADGRGGTPLELLAKRSEPEIKAFLDSKQ